MSSWRRSEPVLWLLGATGVVLVALVQTTVSYRASPLAGVALPVVLATAAAVIWRPVIGVCTAMVAVGLEVLGTQVSAMEALLVLTAAAVLARWAFGVLALRVDPVFLVLGAALLWILAGLGIAVDQFVVVRTLLMWSAFTVVALLVSNASERGMRQVLWAIVAGAAVSSLMALASGTAQEARAGATAVAGRAQGSFTHPAQLAFFLVMALPPALVLAVRSRGALRPVAVAATGLMVFTLLLTLTRGAIIGSAVSLGIMLVWPPFRRIAAVALVALLVFAVANGDAISRSERLNLVGDRLATVVDPGAANVNNQRLRIWRTVPQIWADHPVFGVGVGNFGEYSLRYGLQEGGYGFAHAHNVALTVLAEQGAVGFGLLLLTLWLIARHAAAALGRRTDPRFPYALAPIAGLGGLFVNSLTDYPPGSNPNMALLLIEIGLLVAAVRALRRPQP